jgi:hypothetical protein
MCTWHLTALAGYPEARTQRHQLPQPIGGPPAWIDQLARGAGSPVQSGAGIGVPGVVEKTDVTHTMGKRYDSCP